MRADRRRRRRRLLLSLLAALSLLILLIVQLLAGVTVPGAARAPPPHDEFSFTVISIGNRAGGPWSVESGGSLELWDGERGARGESGPDGLEEEQKGASAEQRGAGEQLELQPWAARQPSFTAELQRFIAYISTPQVQCSQLLYPREDPAGPWALCVDGWTLPVDEPQPCVSYSFSMDQKDADFVDRMLQAGCEVHQFDPSRKQESGSGRLRRHRAWVDWRGSRKLSAIMDTLGHAEVHFLNMDLESAEWRVLESWAADGTLSRIQQLLVTVHLHWAGFEVPGTDAEVLRFWYSVVRRLDASGFDLLYSVGGAGDTILHHLVPGAHSTYSLSWVRTRGPG